MSAAVAADLAIHDFARENPADARLLAAMRREDLVGEVYDPALVADLQRVNDELGAAVKSLARRLYRRATRDAIEPTTCAVIDLPHGAIRRHLVAASTSALNSFSTRGGDPGCARVAGWNPMRRSGPMSDDVAVVRRLFAASRIAISTVCLPAIPTTWRSPRQTRCPTAECGAEKTAPSDTPWASSKPGRPPGSGRSAARWAVWVTGPGRCARVSASGRRRGRREAVRRRGGRHLPVRDGRVMRSDVHADAASVVEFLAMSASAANRCSDDSPLGTVGTGQWLVALCDVGADGHCHSEAARPRLGADGRDILADPTPNSCRA